jgi:hypothetical protein
MKGSLSGGFGGAGLPAFKVLIIYAAGLNPVLAVWSMLLFPKRGPAFEMVHQKISAFKGLAAMARGRRDKYNRFARCDHTDPVDNTQVYQRKPFAGGLCKVFDPGFRKSRIGLKLQGRNLASLASGQTGETYHGTDVRLALAKSGEQGPWIKALGL